VIARGASKLVGTLAGNYDVYSTTVTGNNGGIQKGGEKLVTSTLSNKTNGKYEIYWHDLSATSSSQYLLKNRAKYSFGSILTGGEYWPTYGQNYEFAFQGSGDYSQQDISQFRQEYQFRGVGVTGLANNGFSSWNMTNGNYTNSAWNRALGTSSQSGTSQSHSTLVATPFEDNSSSLLGLQSLNSTDDRNDTNTNRPQLNASYRKTGDAFNYTIPDDKSINGKYSRTGQPYSLYSFVCPFKLKIYITQ
jgi:hypothetical protein